MPEETLPPSLFTRLNNEVTAAGLQRRTAEAREWFIDYVKQLNGRINRNALLRDQTLSPKKTPLWGYMYMFAYDPKTKEDMPYHDRFPLVIMTETAPGGFYGLNLHYLHPRARAIFLDKLMSTLGGQELTERTRLRTRYQLLQRAKKFREFAPCFKHYLFDHVKSRIAQVPSTEWDIAIFLPTEQFRGASKTKVWADSKKEYLSR